jgi:hypothetical protein
MENQNNQIVKTGDWVLTLFICAIPLIGLIMLFVWAFSGGTNPSKANWAKACLIWLAIGFFLTVIIFALFGAAFSNIFS